MRYVCVLAAMLLVGCGSKPSSMEDLGTRDVVLPGGQIVRVETMIDTKDLLRGLMFRTSLPPDRGMLFIHLQPGHYPYWTYQHKIPLDMIWMDADKQVVEIVPNAPPCQTNASRCPHFGGNYMAQYVLQLAGGMARKYGVRVGDRVSF